MKILLNIKSIRRPLTGIGHYVQYLLRCLQTHSSIEQCATFPAQQPYQEEYHFSARSFSWLCTKMESLSLAYQAKHYFNNYIFSRKTVNYAKEQFLYHEPNYILHPYSGKKICTIHDLSYIRYPEHHPHARVKFLERRLPSSIEQATHIITGSSHTRNELLTLLSVPVEKISVVYHGVDTTFKPRALSATVPVQKRYRLQNRAYLLTVSTIEPRKNLTRLMQAYAQLPNQLRNQHPLVIVGINGWGESVCAKTMRYLVNQQQLLKLGYVPSQDLPFIYAGAHAFVYLSLYEGFGLPLIEAMASGVPVLCSNSSSMPEVVGDAGLITEPRNISYITEKLEQLLTDECLRVQLKQRGFIQSAKFTWQNCINNTVKVYEETLRQ